MPCLTAPHDRRLANSSSKRTESVISEKSGKQPDLLTAINFTCDACITGPISENLIALLQFDLRVTHA